MTMNNAHNQLWQALITRVQNNTLPHAMLFVGANKIGKEQFALEFGAYLLCEQPVDENACGQCRSCKLLQTQTHPDLFVLQPEEKSVTIKVDQIRSLSSKLYQTAQLNGYQVVLINPADAMNIAAYNSLLKTLEEPSGKVVIILITSKLALLPATIRSRCQLLQFLPENKLAADKWLVKCLLQDDKQTYATLFTDLSALVLSKSTVLDFADKWHSHDILQLLDYWYLYCLDILKVQQGIQDDMLLFAEQRQQLVQLAKSCCKAQLISFSDTLQQAKKKLNNNLNPQLLLEDLGRIFQQMSTSC